MPDSFPARWSSPAVILVATDLSDLDTLMPHAIEQAALSHARLVLLHVLAPQPAIPVKEMSSAICDAVEAVGVARHILKPWCTVAAARHLDCSSSIREGDPAHQIALAADLFTADRILLGTRNPDKKHKLELGSVAGQVLRSVNIPVITVGPEAHLPVETGDRPPVVLHATTLRETSRPSAALACQIAAQQAARLVLLHVAPHIDEMRRTGQLPGTHSQAMKELALLCSQASACGCSSVRIEPRIVHGNRLIEILATAAESQACLIVLGIEGESAFDNLTREHAILQVLAHAQCPVMLLRNPCAVTDDVLEPAAAAVRG